MAPGRLGSDHGVPVVRRWDAERVGLGDRFAQKFDQGVADAHVLYAAGREK